MYDNKYTTFTCKTAGISRVANDSKNVRNCWPIRAVLICVELGSINICYAYKANDG